MSNSWGTELKPNPMKAWEFLNWLSPNGPHRIETIVSEGSGRLVVRTFTPDEYEAFAQFCEEQNSTASKRNVYFLASASFLNGERRAKENIQMTDIVQVDIDSKDFPGTEKERLDQALSLVLYPNVRPQGIPAPSAVSFTGGGYQAFWKLQEPIEASLAEELNKGLIAALNGDVGTHDVGHLMRLPGTVNWLNDKKRAAGRQPEEAIFLDPANTKNPPVFYRVDDFKFKRPKSGSASSEQKPAANIDAVGEPEPLPADLSEILPDDPKWVKVMMTGEDPPGKAYGSRSELAFAFTIRMLSHGMKPGHLLSILMDSTYGISAHVLDQSKPLRSAKRMVAEAQARLARPEILILAGKLPSAVDAAEQALIMAGVPIYQRYDSLVRIVRLPDGNGEDGIQRDNGALILKPITTPWLREQFALAAHWKRIVGEEEKKVPADPPPDAANAYLARAGEWKVPPLQAITQIPTLRGDGTILQEPGYDRRLQILYDPGTVEFPDVPENPGKEEAQAALELLFSPFRDFRFARPVDKSVAMAAVLTALVRRMFPSSPLFIIEAPEAGTGKTLFCETLGIIMMGHKPAMMSQGKTVEEQEKRLSSAVMAGDPLIVIDNCERPIEGDFLCTMLTQEWVRARILGKSEMLRLPTRTLVIATSNNPQVAGDVTRRALKCRLDAQVERPDLLQYDFDPRDEAYAQRPELVVAGLTVIRAYIAAGRPVLLDKIGSFERWNIIREALVWLGVPDPAGAREEIFDNDPRKGELIDLLRLWWKAFGNERLTLADLAMRHEHGNATVMAEVVTELIANTRYPTFNKKSIGKFLASKMDRIAGGLMLRSEKDSSGVKRYWVVNVAKEAAPESEEESMLF